MFSFQSQQRWTCFRIVVVVIIIVNYVVVLDATRRCDCLFFNIISKIVGKIAAVLI